tara:strand:+ start:396 stop:905 length:510 start_codon:yes stop_codon:yes gene_type:complete
MKKLKSIFVAALAIMLPMALAAAPPAPELPTGACAGVIKSNSHVAYSASNVLSLAGTVDEGLGELHASIYLDFDNSLAYVSVALEKAATTEQVDETGDDTSVETVTLVDGEAFTIEVSQSRPYALNLSVPFSYLDEEDILSAMLIPTNSGTTFLFHELNGPMSGVCQKI